MLATEVSIVSTQGVIGSIGVIVVSAASTAARLRVTRS